VGPALLYIDDSHGNLDALEKLVEHYLPEVRVFPARTSDEGMAVAAQRDINVIMVDIGLRGATDGLWLIREFRDEPRTAHIPILAVIPPATDQETVFEALEMGADDFISQLFEPTEVKARLTWALRLEHADDLLRGAGLNEDKMVASVPASMGGGDMTEQRCLEDQFHHAQKMDALGQLSSSVAHDFKNLLHGILGFTELLRANLARESEEFVYLREIEAVVERGGVLTQQLDAFGRRSRLTLVDLDINNFVEEILGRFRASLSERVGLELLLTPDLPMTQGDSAKLELALTHLFDNAVEAMQQGGGLTVTTGLVRFTELDLQDFPWATAGRYLTVSVDDTGSGMDLEVQSRIFEPFFTTKVGGSHNGLGLAIVHGIVTQHQGNIEVLSSPDWGTDVTVYLPTVERERWSSAVPPSPAPVHGARTILLAEDDDVVRILTARVLERSGSQVLLARDGVEALEVFEANSDRIVLAVLDVAMPHLGGNEVYTRIRAVRPDLPVIFVTGHGGDAIGRGFDLDGSADILEKPFRPPTLLRKIRELLQRG
jgi:signal transduction histidine kinase